MILSFLARKTLIHLWKNLSLSLNHTTTSGRLKILMDLGGEVHYIIQYLFTKCVFKIY